MKKRKTVWMVFLIFVFMLCLTGCGQKHVDVQTLLNLKEDHTGSRQISLLINKNDFEKVFTGTIDQLNERLDTACPSELEWTYMDEEEQYKYIFTLHFSSLEDYQEKVESITGKKSVIIMEQPESVFASGLLYEEDFDSIELISWLGTFLEQQGYLKEGQGAELFSESAVKVVFKGTEYQLGAGKIRVDTLVRTPVERIDILTHYRQNKHCDRQVVFSFSGDSISKNGTGIKAYLEKNRPDGAELAWSEKNGNSLCTVSAEDCTAKEMNQFMQELLGESESFISVQPGQRAGIFEVETDWNELIDVRNFSYNNEKIAVGYYVQWEDGMNVSIHRQNSDTLFELEESEIYGGYRMVLEQDLTTESLVTQVSTTYVIEEVEVDTEFRTVDNLSRSITLIFQVKPDREDQENIRKKIARKAKGVAEVTNGEEREDGRSCVVITQTGSIDDLNGGFRQIFDVQGQLAHKTGGDLLEFQHEGSFVDLMDFTNFLENDPLLTTLTYHLKLPKGERIQKDTISSTVSLKQGTQEVSGSQYTGRVAGAYLSLTLNSQVWNTDGIMLFLLILGFVLIALAVMFLADFSRKAYENVKNGVRIFNGAFRENDDVLDDFPDDREEEKNGFLPSLGSRLKKNNLKEGLKFPLKKEEKRWEDAEKNFEYPEMNQGNPGDIPPSAPENGTFWEMPGQVKYEEQRFEENNAEENAEENKEEKGEESEDFDPESMVERITEISIENPDHRDLI